MATDAAVHPVEEGGTAGVRLTVATTGSAPIDEPVTVAYETTGGTASGSDYTPIKGKVTFPVSTASGTSRTVRVRTLEDRSAEAAETIPLKLTVTGAEPPPRPRRSWSTPTGCRI